MTKPLKIARRTSLTWRDYKHAYAVKCLAARTGTLIIDERSKYSRWSEAIRVRVTETWAIYCDFMLRVATLDNAEQDHIYVIPPGWEWDEDIARAVIKEIKLRCNYDNLIFMTKRLKECDNG